MEKCEWCEQEGIRNEKQTVYWELPDGTKAIEITETPTIVCTQCGMNYQTEQTINEIEEQLLLINTKNIDKKISFSQLMSMPRWLKENYFDF